jgi:hypothetical protein
VPVPAPPPLAVAPRPTDSEELAALHATMNTMNDDVRTTGDMARFGTGVLVRRPGSIDL